MKIVQKGRVAARKEKAEVERKREEQSPAEGFAIQAWKRERHPLVMSLEN